MTDKRSLNLALPPPDVVEAFRKQCEQLGHGRNKGLVLAAAIRQFLASDPATQQQQIEAAIRAEVATRVAKRREGEG